ncbi:MAG TPA: hypothetical protein DDZ76_11180 [Xanthomonadales bacterium]|nr:hypothetical protein [Xanthomonadales bacterium]
MRVDTRSIAAGFGCRDRPRGNRPAGWPRSMISGEHAQRSNDEAGGSPASSCPCSCRTGHRIHPRWRPSVAIPIILNARKR